MTPHGPARSWLSTAPALLLLGGTVLHWCAGELSGRLITLGESIWPGYAIELRLDRPPADAPRAPAPPGAADEGLIGDLLDDGAAPADGADDALIGDLLGDDPPAAPAPGAADDALIGDLLEDAPPAAAPPPAAAAPPPAAEVPPAAQPGPPRPDPGPGLRLFRAIDLSVAAFASWGGARFGHALIALLLIAGTTATAARAHIGLRAPTTRLDHLVSEGAQLAANLAITASLVQLWRLNTGSGAALDRADLPLGWAVAFAAMGLLNLRHLLRPPEGLTPGGTLTQALLTPPLYAGMALASTAWFVLGEGYLAGLAVYLQKLIETAELYLFVGLYVWTGMLLKRTRLADRSFALLRPWGLPPELLAAVLVVMAAIPTAYSGASGIFVIAAGGLMFRELRSAGAHPQLALAATAMSGSLGVVLSPCLLVVIIAYLNPPTTEVLYGWGRYVFILTAVLFTGALLLTRRGPLRPRPRPGAGAATLGAARALAPALAAGLAVPLIIATLLGSHLDEHTAPVLLPLALMAVMLVDRAPDGPGPDRSTVRDATRETTEHMGALLLLMCLSIALGGVFERSDVMSLVPADLGSPVVAMGVLVVLLVVIGMTMDPYGAVILVSATLARVAAQNGIDEAHFWMVVLVAFELGYLTPPVALNHLLTRQVVGAEAWAEAEAAPAVGWRRHEHIVLPISVLGLALLLVAFVPLLLSTRG